MGRTHAVVMGGSVAGLAAARVLADHFARVTVVERDVLPDGPEHRKGAPQGRHNHVLLRRGRLALEGLFPGLVADLTRHGAVDVDTAQAILWHHCGVYKKRFASGLTACFMSRPLLEWRLRTHLLRLPNVRLLAGCAVTGLLHEAERITGLETEPGERLTADLVVDALGRATPTPGWLAELGYPTAPVEEVKVNIRYATRVYRIPERRPDWHACILSGDPPQPRSGVLFPLEGDRWIVGLQGYFGNQPPTDEDGFLAFARSLPTLDLYEAIRQAEPLSEIMPGGLPSHLWRHHERAERFPAGLVALGDAVCSLNPVFAHGMTLAALGAETLGNCLQEGDLTPFRQRLAGQVAGAWQGATGEDLKYPETEGTRPPGLPVISWYTRRIARACARDEEVMRRFVKLTHLLEGPQVLFSLRTIWKALTAP